MTTKLSSFSLALMLSFAGISLAACLHDLQLDEVTSQSESGSATGSNTQNPPPPAPKVCRCYTGNGGSVACAACDQETNLYNCHAHDAACAIAAGAPAWCSTYTPPPTQPTATIGPIAP